MSSNHLQSEFEVIVRDTAYKPSTAHETYSLYTLTMGLATVAISSHIFMVNLHEK